MRTVIKNLSQQDNLILCVYLLVLDKDNFLKSYHCCFYKQPLSAVMVIYIPVEGIHQIKRQYDFTFYDYEGSA
jgi:hypothetical protein